ncbi:Metallo-dependent hydrolase [Aaosphaeria arxii CBS 175.79]|uniref:Metallo-dependent hydrolase n=1 Tax=Aaosphaeria arxii CBS 175.79 TaxID=1450172 RepID=A0A6A5XBK5_9PLEO|nr:Metallo-dependent hydrolase [Aaosphaeria arxii CBS 175.79]KAF2010311.1 Metallo-dependent hydrolase [Aaosphaeria arxii CBS 175.79]
MNPPQEKEPFPWSMGVYDAHCHPTDTMTSIPAIKTMKTRILTVMATRSQDQELVTSVADSHSVKSPFPEKWSDDERIVPCFGWHPWFSHQMYVAEGDDVGDVDALRDLVGEEKVRHYQRVLLPRRDDPSEEDLRIFRALPDPTPFQKFLAEAKRQLQKYPLAQVGEIGLDRSFRVPEPWAPDLEDKRDKTLTIGGREGRRLTPFRVDMKHQKMIVKMQFQLAAEMNRAVSVHGVQAHGMVFDTLKELYEGHEKKVLSKREKKKQGTSQPTETSHSEVDTETTSPPYPPRICLHSYSGNASNFKQYLNPAIPVEIFASFSTAINLSDDLDGETPKSFEEMIQIVPDHMLLIESDLHTAGEHMDTRIEDIARRICKVKGWKLEEGVRILGDNWRRFIFGDVRDG